MGSSAVTESVVEDAALAWLGALGYAVDCGADTAIGGRELLNPAQCQRAREYALCAELVPHWEVKRSRPCL